MEKEKLSFDSYNGMSRVAMFWGVPIFPLLFCFVGILFFGVIGFTLFGMWGGVLISPFIILVIFIRIVCEKDDKYLRRILFMVKRLFLNRKYGKNLLLTPQNPRWSLYYGRRFAQKRILSGK